MRAKKPPPDTIGNVRGRIAELKRSVRRNAAMEVREGGDYDKALAKGMKSVARDLKKFEARLAKVRKTDKSARVGSGRSSGKKSKARGARKKKAEKAPQTLQKKAKKRSATKVPADYDDLLETLQKL